MNSRMSSGNSRWISEHWKLRMEMSQREWFAANLAILNLYSDQIPARATFYRRHGLDEARLEQFLSQAVLYRDGVELPQDYRRLSAGDVLAIGGDRWTVITGEGHSPEHVSLYCATRRILIAGDQILPAITTNVSTWQVEPEFDAVGAFLRTCKTFLGVLDRDDWIAVAGVHVVSRSMRVAALGNVATDPRRRGRGLGRTVCAAVVEALANDVDIVGLNVAADNAGAIACYRSLGFERVCSYEEVLLTRRSASG